MNNAVDRWRRIGLPESAGGVLAKHVEGGLKWKGRYVDLCGPSTRESPALPSDDGRKSDLYMYYDMIQLAHLGFEQPFGDTWEQLIDMADLAIDYFCGEWRDHAAVWEGVLDRETCRRQFDWLDEFRVGLVATTILRREGDVEKIASFVGRDLPVQEGAWDRTDEDNAFFVVLGLFLQGDALAECCDLVESIENSRKRRPKDLLACLQAIDQKDAKRFTKQLAKCAKQFCDKELDTKHGRVVASWDATILWNLAEIRGLNPEPLEQKLMDFVITRESLRLDQPRSS